MICSFLVNYVYYLKSSQSTPSKKLKKTQTLHDWFLINSVKIKVTKLPWEGKSLFSTPQALKLRLLFYTLSFVSFKQPSIFLIHVWFPMHHCPGNTWLRKSRIDLILRFIQKQLGVFNLRQMLARCQGHIYTSFNGHLRDHKFFHEQPRAYIRCWLFALWILGHCICYIGTYIYALGCWCQNSMAFKGLTL